MSSIDYQPPNSALALAPLAFDNVSQELLEAQEPVLAYRPPSYNYHLPPDLDRSARCGLFEDQGNAYATSSSEASPCLATPQTLHPTQVFGHPPHTYSPLEQMQFVESLNNAFSVAAMKQDIPTYESTYPSSFDLHPVYPNSTMYYSETAQFTVRPYSPTLTSACAPYPPTYLQSQPQPHYVHQPLEIQSNMQHLLPGPSYSVQPTVMNGHPSIIAPRPSLAGWPRDPAIAQRLEHAADTVDHSHQFLLVGTPDKVQDADSGDLDASKKIRKKPPALSCYFCRHRKIRCCDISEAGEAKRCNQCDRRRRKCEYPPETTRTDRRRTRKATLATATVDAQRV